MAPAAEWRDSARAARENRGRELKNSKRPAWNLRTYRPGDERGIVELFRSGYGLDLEEAAWRWKFDQLAPATENVWLAVSGAGRPVFHYGGMPRRLALADGPRDAMVTCDGVTDPGFRRQGIFTTGMTESHAAWSAAGIACVLGLPNNQWGSRIQALDWRPLFALRWRILVLRPEAVLAKRWRLPPMERLKPLGWLTNALWRRSPDPTVEVRIAEEAEEQLSGLWELCRDGGRIGLVRDRQWLAWRYFSCPLHRYRMMTAHRGDELSGYLVYRYDAEHRYGFIAEVLTRPGDAAARATLVGAAVDRLSRRGAIGVAALAPPGTGLHAALRRAGFLWSWGSFIVHCVPLAEDLPMSDLCDARRWSIHGGDFDVI